MEEKKEYIENLLNKFFKGQTTEMEENILSDYFDKAEHLPHDWLVYKDIFASFKTDAYDFDGRLLNSMLEPQKDNRWKTVGLYCWLSVACAAVVALFVVLHSWDGLSENAGRQDSQMLTKVVSKPSAVNTVKIVGATRQKLSPSNKEMVGRRHTETKEKSAEPARGNVVDLKSKIDEMIASVTSPDEQVERYEIRNVGDACILTKYLNNGTSASYIMSGFNDESGELLMAFNEK